MGESRYRTSSRNAILCSSLLWCTSLDITSNLHYSLWKRLESQHYRAIRAAVREFKRKIPRVTLDVVSKIAPPRMWWNYSTASRPVNLYNTSNTRQQNSWENYHILIYDRRPKKALKRKIGVEKRWKIDYCMWITYSLTR